MPRPHFATTENVAVVLYYFPAGEMQGDLDNILKLIMDALKQHVFVDDDQVERILVHKLEPEKMPALHASASDTLRIAWEQERPLLYVRVTDKREKEIM